MNNDNYPTFLQPYLQVKIARKIKLFLLLISNFQPLYLIFVLSLPSGHVRACCNIVMYPLECVCVRVLFSRDSLDESICCRLVWFRSFLESESSVRIDKNLNNCVNLQVHYFMSCMNKTKWKYLAPVAMPIMKNNQQLFESLNPATSIVLIIPLSKKMHLFPVKNSLEKSYQKRVFRSTHHVTWWVHWYALFLMQKLLFKNAAILYHLVCVFEDVCHTQGGSPIQHRWSHGLCR